jgi:hypothetical protein
MIIWITVAKQKKLGSHKLIIDNLKLDRIKLHQTSPYTTHKPSGGARLGFASTRRTRVA